MIFCGDVVRWAIPLMPLAGAEPGNLLEFVQPVELQFLRCYVASGGERRFFNFQCQQCRMQDCREARLYTTPIFEMSYAGNVPDDIERWLRDHAELHRVMAMWWNGIAVHQRRS